MYNVHGTLRKLQTYLFTEVFFNFSVKLHNTGQDSVDNVDKTRHSQIFGGLGKPVPANSAILPKWALVCLALQEFLFHKLLFYI